MKKIYILIIILLTFNILNAQWDTQNSGVTVCLNSVYFTDINTGYAVGDSGTVIKTIDGGTNWFIQVSGTNRRLNSVKLIDNNIGIIVGDTGTILKTSNGGINWNLINSGVTNFLTSFCFADANTCYCVGDDIYTSAVILKSVDTGDNWTVIQDSFSNTHSTILKAVFFIDADTGFAGGSGNTMRTIIKTTDGGNNWDLIYSEESYTVRSIFFINNSLGYAVGDGFNILKTTDGGAVWNTYDEEISENKRSIFFINDDTGYIAIGNVFGYDLETYKILKTTDSGNNWIEILSGVNTYLKSIYFINSDVGFAVGGHGAIFKTSTGGVIPINQELSDSNNFFLVYPNPVKDKLTIETLKVTQESYFSIYNIRGKELISNQIKNNKTQIDINKLNRGVYLLYLTNKNNIEVRKIIKE